MTSVVAIDFGTTRTKLAYRPEAGRPELMRFEHDRPYTPSLFYLKRDAETILWGDEAEEMLKDDPAGVVEVLKRKLREPQIRANRRREAPQRLLAHMLADLRRQAGEQVTALAGRAPARATLTLPALYGPVEEKILREAAGEAGFAEVEVVAEPVAAARAWLAETGEEAKEVVVFDAGGGTLDWAYLRRTGEDFCIVADCPPGGDRHVGGHDVDMELLNLLHDELDDSAAETELAERQVHYLVELRERKERLGRGLPIRPLKVGAHSVRLDETKMRAVIEDRFVAQACIGLGSYLERVRGACGGRPVPVLLVGGSSRLEGLQPALEQRLGCTTVRWERSEYATVLGGVGPPADAVVARRAVTDGPMREAHVIEEARPSSEDLSRGSKEVYKSEEERRAEAAREAEEASVDLRAVRASIINALGEYAKQRTALTRQAYLEKRRAEAARQAEEERQRAGAALRDVEEQQRQPPPEQDAPPVRDLDELEFLTWARSALNVKFGVDLPLTPLNARVELERCGLPDQAIFVYWKI